MSDSSNVSAKSVTSASKSTQKLLNTTSWTPSSPRTTWLQSVLGHISNNKGQYTFLSIAIALFAVFWAPGLIARLMRKKNVKSPPAAVTNINKPGGNNADNLGTKDANAQRVRSPNNDPIEIKLQNLRKAREILGKISPDLKGGKITAEMICDNITKIIAALLSAENAACVDDMLSILALPEYTVTIKNTAVYLEVLQDICAKLIQARKPSGAKEIREIVESLYTKILPYDRKRSQFISNTGECIYPLKFMLAYQKPLKDIGSRAPSTGPVNWLPKPGDHYDNLYKIGHYILMGDHGPSPQSNNEVLILSGRNEKYEVESWRLGIGGYSIPQIQSLIDELGAESKPALDSLPHEPPTSEMTAASDTAATDAQESIASKVSTDKSPEDSLVSRLTALGFQVDSKKLENVRAGLERVIREKRAEDERLAQNEEEFKILRRELFEVLSKNSPKTLVALDNFFNMPSRGEPAVYIIRHNDYDLITALTDPSYGAGCPFKKFSSFILEIDGNDDVAFMKGQEIIEHWFKSNMIKPQFAQQLRSYIFKEYVKNYPYKARKINTQQDFFDTFDKISILLKSSEFTSDELNSIIHAIEDQGLLPPDLEKNTHICYRYTQETAELWTNYLRERSKSPPTASTDSMSAATSPLISTTKLEAPKENPMPSQMPFITWSCAHMKIDISDIEIKPQIRWPLNLFPEGAVDLNTGEVNSKIIDEVLDTHLEVILAECSGKNIIKVMKQLDLKGFIERNPGTALPIVTRLVAFVMDPENIKRTQYDSRNYLISLWQLICGTVQQKLTIGDKELSLTHLLFSTDEGQADSSIAAWADYVIGVTSEEPEVIVEEGQLRKAVIHLDTLKLIASSDPRTCSIISKDTALASATELRSYVDSTKLVTSKMGDYKSHILNHLQSPQKEQIEEQLNKINYNTLAMSGRVSTSEDLFSDKAFCEQLSFFTKLNYDDKANLEVGVKIIRFLWETKSGSLYWRDDSNFWLLRFCIRNHKDIALSTPDNGDLSIDFLIERINILFYSIQHGYNREGRDNDERQQNCYRENCGISFERALEDIFKLMNTRFFHTDSPEKEALHNRMRSWVLYLCYLDRYIPIDDTPFTKDQTAIIKMVAQLNPCYISERLPRLPQRPSPHLEGAISDLKAPEADLTAGGGG